jgi:tetratricopeptide (TPR) repeat protein
LGESGERNDVAARHCRYFAGVALEASDTYWRTDSDRWTAQLRHDLENHRAAIVWGFHDGDATAAAIVAGLRWLWYATARHEGHALLARAAARAGAEPVRVRGLLALAGAVFDNTAQAATPAAEAALALSGGVDDLGYAEARAFQGAALGRGGHLAESVAHLEAAIAAARAAHAPRLIGWVLSMAAYWIGANGDRALARDLFDEAAEILRACNDPWQLARLQLHRAEFLFSEGDLAAALDGVREAEAIFRERNADSGLCVSVLNATAYMLALSRLDDGWTFAREGLELSLRSGNTMSSGWAIGHLAHVAAETGDATRAARLLGYVEEAYRKTGSAREPTEQRGYERALALIRANLPEERIAVLTAEGTALDQDGATAEAMAVARPDSGANG